MQPVKTSETRPLLMRIAFSQLENRPPGRLKHSRHSARRICPTVGQADMPVLHAGRNMCVGPHAADSAKRIRAVCGTASLCLLGSLHDLTAIISIAPCSETWRLFKSAAEENLLHIAISEADCPRLPAVEAITIPIIKTGEEMPQILLDLRTSKIYKWKSSIIIYDDSISRDMTTRIIGCISHTTHIETQAASVSLMKLKSNSSFNEMRDNLKEILHSIRTNTMGRNFMIIVKYEFVETVMEYAKLFKLVHTKSQWLYVITDTNFKTHNIMRFKRLLKEGDNVAFVYNYTTIHNKCTSGIVCHSQEIVTSFSKALDEAIVDEFEVASQVSDEEWNAIRPSKAERRNWLLNKMKTDLLQNGICGNCTKWKFQTGETWGKEYSQNNTSESTADILSVGTWRPSDGPTITDELFPHITQGFRGKTLPVLTFHNPPWQIIRTNESGHIVEYKGLVFDIIKELANNLNFTYTVEIAKSTFKKETFTNVTDYAISETLTNEIPSVFYSLIQNKTIALGACAFTITEESKNFINFTIPITTQTYTFLVARPRELSRALLFISPFTGDTWLCLSAAIVFVGPILYYIHRCSPVYEYKGLPKRGGLSSIENCIWYMYGALLQQGGMHLPSADSARILVGSWWLVVLVVATTYCGNLVAFLTFPKIDIPITTTTELLAHRETVTWSLPPGSFLEKEIKQSGSKFKQIYDGRLKVKKTPELLKLIENGKHVFLDWKIRLQYIMKQQHLETDRCDLALGLEEFIDEQIALIVAQDSPYLNIINDEIKKLHQVGLIDKWLKDYLPKKDKCWKNRHIIEVNNHTVNMDDMQGSFFVLFFGFLVGFFIILMEKLWYHYMVERKKKIIQPFIS
ncbi:unnamed protein product [Brassicogethes aeneus]|uniref:Ionotropic receptor 93a n=1 Tax=Brassicogethes aeneus TaxID=1431903 RepID=A0A9P0B160_BRAAE|nr:unnamed protein product [Brassicogethes aeneus]